jgi:hypothetical protein
MSNAATQDIPELPEGFCDISGFAVFSEGVAGHAHAVAHWLLDRGRFETGRRYLTRWLDGRTGSGSEWVHLQWHLAVFELAVGHWEQALARYDEHVLPAVPRGEAHTDAPELLWRLRLSAGRAASLPWDAVRDAALEGLGQPCRAYVELHHLLALAGAADEASVAAIEAWLARESGPVQALDRGAVVVAVRGLLAYARRDYASASRWLGSVSSQLSRIGGSRAQNELFERIAADANARARTERSDWRGPAA